MAQAVIVNTTMYVNKRNNMKKSSSFTAAIGPLLAAYVIVQAASLASATTKYCHEFGTSCDLNYINENSSSSNNNRQKKSLQSRSKGGKSSSKSSEDHPAAGIAGNYTICDLGGVVEIDAPFVDGPITRPPFFSRSLQIENLGYAGSFNLAKLDMSLDCILFGLNGTNVCDDDTGLALVRFEARSSNRLSILVGSTLVRFPVSGGVFIMDPSNTDVISTTISEGFITNYELSVPNPPKVLDLLSFNSSNPNPHFFPAVNTGEIELSLQSLDKELFATLIATIGLFDEEFNCADIMA